MFAPGWPTWRWLSCTAPLAPLWPWLTQGVLARRMLAVLATTLAGLLLLGWASAAWAQGLQPVPPLSARVTDLTGTLQPAQREALEAQLAAFEAEAGPQIVILMVASTAPEDIAAYAYRVADAWKVGRREVGDGVLMLVAKDDRRARIEVARALEGAIPDLAARQIIDRALAPAFKAGDYAGGLRLGVEQLQARIRGENLPPPQPGRQRPRQERGLAWDQLALFFFVGVPIVGGVLTGVMGRKLGGLATGGAAGGLAWWLSASLLIGGLAGVVALVLVAVLGIGASSGRHRSGGPPIWGGGGGGWGGGGGGWGGGGGGGFSSGGGGSFGGGGASGGW